jgi:hypothetical protein
MLGADITDFCHSHRLLRKHFISVIGADQVKKIKRDHSNRNCFYVANTEKVRH